MRYKDKFYQLAKNIVNYPYDKAVYCREGRIRKIDVYTNWPLDHETVTFYNYPDLVGTKGIDVMLNSCWIRVDTDDSVYINEMT